MKEIKRERERTENRHFTPTSAGYQLVRSVLL